DLLALDLAIARLQAVDGHLDNVVELRYFAGLSELEIAVRCQRSERSIGRDWQMARLFLLSSVRVE
uniref:ECF-type sigma factor n=1 Tax=Stenotrophomonas sp. SrG TaxID=3414430 RepID=UPI003CF97A14